MSDLTQLRQEEKTVFQDKMIQVVYQLFNALHIKTKGFTSLFSQKESEQTEEQMQIPLFSEEESEQTEEKMQRPLCFKIIQSFTNEPATFTIIKITEILKLLQTKKTYDLKNEKIFGEN